MTLIAALSEYRQAGEAVFTPSDSVALEGGADSVAAADLLLARSQEIERTAALDLASGDSDVRELAALQLAAAAALDIAAAADTLRLTEGGDGAALSDDGNVASGDDSVFTTTYASLRPILEAETALGARAVAGVSPADNGAALAGEEATAELLTVATKAIEGISGDAAKIAGHAVDGLAGIPQDALLGAFGEAADRLLGPLVTKAKLNLRAAIRHLLKAVSKLLRLLGPIEAVARKWLKGKLGELTQDRIVAFVIDRALEGPRLQEELKRALDGAGAGADDDRLTIGRREVESLAKRFGRHEKVVRVLAKVLELVRGTLLGLAQWAAAAVAGVYVLVLTYGIWVAGDFLDWYRTAQDGRLDRVAGVRSTALAAVA